MEDITSFSGDYRFLSNFWDSIVTLDGVTYPSVECAYQAAKTLDLTARIPFQTYTAAQAKRNGKLVVMREDWNDVKLSIMTDLVTQKFTNHPELSRLLLATNGCQLIEGNTWNDVYWGVCRGVGSNHLGRILMRIRDLLSIEKNISLI